MGDFPNGVSIAGLLAACLSVGAMPPGRPKQKCDRYFLPQSTCNLGTHVTQIVVEHTATALCVMRHDSFSMYWTQRRVCPYKLPQSIQIPVNQFPDASWGLFLAPQNKCNVTPRRRHLTRNFSLQSNERPCFLDEVCCSGVGRHMFT